jgi:hypothetical protein
MLTVTVRQPDWQKAIQGIAEEQMPIDPLGAG